MMFAFFELGVCILVKVHFSKSYIYVTTSEVGMIRDACF